MHLIHTYSRKNQTHALLMIANATEKEPFGPAFTEREVAQADKMEHWGSSFNDQGPDFNEFRLIKNDKIIFKKRVNGY